MRCKLLGALPHITSRQLNVSSPISVSMLEGDDTNEAEIISFENGHDNEMHS